MTALHVPWIELSILVPLVGAAWVSRARRSELAHHRASWIAAVVLLLTVGEALDFAWSATDVVGGGFGVTIDGLSAPLLPLTALVYFVTLLATPREKAQRFAFPLALVRESLALATFSFREPAVVIPLLALSAVAPWFELRARGASTSLYTGHAAAFVALLGGAGIAFALGLTGVGAALTGAACLLRAGVPPFHLWVTELFVGGSFGGAILFVGPIVGAYGFERLVVPYASSAILWGFVVSGVLGAVYAAGMAATQTEARRFFSMLTLCQGAMILAGLAVDNKIGAAGALSLWISAALSLAGLGLVLRAAEARIGRFSIEEFLGLYPEFPQLAALFLLTGLALVGFPGTIGFVGIELLVEGSAAAHPLAGGLILLASALSGVAVLRAYLRTFTGTRRRARPVLEMRRRERATVLLLSGIVIGGGIYPQPGITSRYRAALAQNTQKQESRLDPLVAHEKPEPAPVVAPGQASAELVASRNALATSCALVTVTSKSRSKPLLIP